MVNLTLIIALPLLMAFTMPIFKMLNSKLPKFIALLTTAFNLIVLSSNFTEIMAAPLILELGGWQAPFAINLYVGPLALVAAFLINGSAFILSIYNLSQDYQFDDKFYLLFLMITAGASGMVMTGDLFNLFVFIEITSIAAYSLTTFAGGSSYEASFKYLIIGGVGSVFLLLGIGFTYSAVGSLNLAEIAASAGLINPLLLQITALLFLIGIGIEAELFPLNFWVPDIYTEAPTAVSGIMSGAVSAAGIYALARIFFTLFPAQQFFNYLLVIGVITLIMGELIAYQQENIKRMLAYSSLAQMGLIVTVISLGTEAAVKAGLFQLINHSILKVLLFISAGVLISAAGSKKIKDLAGLGTKKPTAAFGFTIAAMGILGVPFLNGFISKFMIISSSLNADQFLITFLILAAALIEIAYYLKVVQKLYFEDLEIEVKNTAVITVPVILLTLLIIGLGVYPQLIAEPLEKAAAEILNNSRYIMTVLGGI
ncbi:Membrane bound protein complex subunit mbxH [Halanaerobium saccharolyticum]|uniref:Membrane bound protein complex subunit mbxH n=1 Tax=Halanaerobium saccharolyticum TaxID=43595 RepID=A0A4R6LNZ9_9FIRM|nr:proton-conducting transporter membrane subunit [Halanaerobium saccharolyticum]TDO84614.1 Membrane bound protein complex subunit mbxH [Halanaerobium saccharolyticum]